MTYIFKNITFNSKEKMDLEFETFLKELENLYIKQEVDSYFDDIKDNVYVNFVTKDELDKYALANSSSYTKTVPHWLEGISNDKEAYIVFPDFEKKSYYLKLTLHEIIHLLSNTTQYKKHKNIFLEEGLASYLSNQMDKVKFEKMIEDYSLKSNINIKVFFNLDSTSFAVNNGYYYSFFFIKYLKNVYSKKFILDCLIDDSIILKNINKYNSEFNKFLKDEITKYKTREN